MIGELKPDFATAKEEYNEEKIIREINEFQGTLEEFLKFSNLGFILSKNESDAKDQEHGFFEDLMQNNPSMKLIKSVVDKIVKRERTAIMGKTIMKEDKEEPMDHDAICKISSHILEKLLEYDKEQIIIKKILELYPNYWLGEAQPLIFTDSLTEFLEKYGDKIDKDAQVKMIIDCRANMNVNTDTFLMHEDDYWKLNDLVFNKNKANVGDYLANNENELKEDVARCLKTISFCFEYVTQAISLKPPPELFKDKIDFIRKQQNNENYLLSISAENYIKIIDGLLKNPEQAKIFLRKDITKIENEKLLEHLFSKKLIGRYSKTGDLISSFETKGKDIKNEDLLYDFFGRQLEQKFGTMIFKNFEDVDENYLFFAFSNLNIRKRIETDFDVDLAKFNLFELKQLFYFLKDSDKGKIEKIKKFLCQSKVALSKDNKIKSFLTLEYDKNDGDKIIEIGNKLSPEDADMVFSKIAEIADKVEEGLDGVVDKKDLEFEASGARLELLKKAHQIISNFSESDGKDIQKLLTDLENSRTEIEVLGALLRTAKEQGIKLSPENIRGMELEMRDIGELSGEKKTAFREKYEKPVMSMMEKSYEKIFAGDQGAQEEVRGDFKNRFENLEKYRVYTLMFQGEVAAFMTIQPIKNAEGEVMAESLVVNEEVQKYSMGIAFLKKVMEREFVEHSIKMIRGKTRVGLPAGEAYDRIGLVVDESREVIKKERGDYNWRVAESPIKN